MEISSRTLIPLLMPGSVHNGSAGWDNCGWMFPDQLRVSSLPDRFSYYTWTTAESAHSDFVGSRVHVSLGVTCHLHFGRMIGVFYMQLLEHDSRTDTEQESTHKVDSREETLPLLLPGFEPATFRSWVRRSYQQPIPAAGFVVNWNNCTRSISRWILLPFLWLILWSVCIQISFIWTKCDKNMSAPLLL